MADLAISAEGLVKRYDSFVALDHLSFAVPRGAVYGLLGPNGAGKTTTVRVLTTLLQPDEGRALIDGIDVVSNPNAVRRRIGLTGQFAAIEERLTARESLEIIGRLYHLPRREVRARATELLDRFNLTDVASKVVTNYSGGMRRRLDIAMSLIARPSVLFLDEPTTGLDPRSRSAMWKVIEELADEGTTVLLTTQYLDEADRLADQIMVIDRGAVVASGTADQLKAQVGRDRLMVCFDSRVDMELAVVVLRELGVSALTTDASNLAVSGDVESGRRIAVEAIRALDHIGVEAAEIEVHRPTLDDVFMQFTGHAVEEERGAS